MDETYGTYVDDECFDIHDYDDDTDHDTDDYTDDYTNDGTDDDTDDGGRGNRRPLPGGAIHFSSSPPVPPGGGRTNSWDLDPVWERERERVNRDALTRLKPPKGVGGLIVRNDFNPPTQVAGLVQIFGIWIPSGRGKGRG